MAVFDAILIPAQQPSTVISGLAATTSSVEQALGANVIFSINATQDITIRFGQPGFSASAGASDFRIPSGSTFTFDVGRNLTSFKVYNLGASAANIYILFLSKQ